MSPGRPIVVLAIAATLVTSVLGACSGDDDADDATATTSTAPPVTTAAPTTPPTTPPPTPAPTTPPTTDPFADWCAVATEMEAATADDPNPADPVAVEEFVTGVQPVLERAAAVAPTEIAADVARLAEQLTLLDEALAPVGYDMLLADLAFLAEREEGDDAASAAIDAFNAEHCGITPDGDDTDFSIFADGPLRDRFLVRLVDSGFTLGEAVCIFDHLDFTEVESLDDPAVIAAAFTACDIDAERIAELTGG